MMLCPHCKACACDECCPDGECRNCGHDVPTDYVDDALDSPETPILAKAVGFV